jgi:hypothetical protein
MAQPRLFANAIQDAKGFWWAEDADGNRYAVDPYSDEDFTGYRQVDRRFEETSTPQGAGLPMDSWRWQSGQVLTPQDMAQVAQIMSTPGAYVGVNGPMSVDQYLADPRSAVKVENGQYVYRPEQAQGDWESIDRESFMQSLGALPFVLGGFAAPYLSSLGVIGPGAGVMGSTGNMQFLGDVANVAGAAEGAAGAAGAATGGYEQTFNLGTQSNPLSIPTNEFSLANAGQGYGGVSTAGQGLSLGANSAGGLIGEAAANLATQGGVALSDLATAGIGAGTGAGLGLQLPAGGAITNTAANLAGAAGTTLPTTTGVGSGIGSGVNIATNAAGAGAGLGGATTAASSLLKMFNDQFGTNLTSGDLDLIGKGLGLGLGYLGSKEQADAMQNLYNQQVSLGAPYRAELAKLNTNPSSFYNSDMFKGALQQGSDALARSLSAKVGNPILNPTALQEMQNYTTKGSLDAYNQRWNQLSSAGQLGLGAVPSLGSAAAQASGGTYNALGAGLGSVFGNQRDYAGEFLDLMKRNGFGGPRYNLGP